MRKLLFLATAAIVALSTVSASARPITRVGANYSGLRNPNGCEIGPDDKHPTDLRVKCTSGIGATGPAFVRYRFLRDVGAVQDFATISADIATWIGKDCHAEWMVKRPKQSARTLRVTVPFGSYCHIRSVTWSQ